ncbi:glycosyltransferase family 4 protein [Providencia sp. PROV169]|uniref:glycosyltransferase family 4 protein n=1 Tax=Providencia sp. PROV169 TaxID=2949875 RepID=UPI002349180B|nr:glycosyltransferase family 4 protein [Providencia sp. PROV169]
MTRLIFIQPAIPKYRIPFFQEINKHKDIIIYTAEFDFLGVKTVYSSKNIKLLTKFKKILNGKFYWMKKLPLLSGYTKNDIVIINGNPRILNYMLLFILLKIKGIKTIWWGHGWSAGSHGLASKVRLKIMKLLPDYILLYTDYEKAALNLKNLYSLNNGLDSENYRKYIKSSLTTRIPPSTSKSFNLLFIGRITEKANFTFLLDALAKTSDNIKLNVIGDSKSIDAYKEHARKLKIENRILWHGALFNDADITRVMLESHAFIYPGSVGLSLIHAFNYGLPAIIHSSREYHMPEFSSFVEGKNGFSFKRNDIESLSHTILKISEINEQEYNRLSDGAISTIEETFNIKDMSSRFLKMIQDIECQ